VSKLRPSKRASAAVAAVLATATAAGGYILLPTGEKVPPAVVLAMETLIPPWESTALRAYLDTIANPPVWTICDGDTQNVRAGMVETPAGCAKRLRVRLIEDYYKPLTRCIAGFDKAPASWGAMMISLAWNIGTGAACKSSAARLAREGRYRESCEAATAFNRAGGKVIRGLVLRREMGDATRIGEGELCVSGLEMRAATRAPQPATVEPVEVPAVPVTPPAAPAPAGPPVALAIGLALALAAGAAGLLIWRKRARK
jgi:lysozyme